MEKTLVIFDIDGTLVYSNRIDSLCFASTYESLYGQPFPTIDWLKYPHVTDTTIFKTVIQDHFGRAVSTEEVHLFQDNYVALLEEKRAMQPSEFCEVPFAKQAVDNLLADARFVVGIGTGGWLRPAKVKLNHVKIPSEKLLVGAADGHETREGIINYVIGLARSRHETITRIVYVGDAVWDVKTTSRMNLNFVGIRRDGDFEVLAKEGSVTVLRDFSDYGHFVNAVLEARPPKKINRELITETGR